MAQTTLVHTSCLLFFFFLLADLACCKEILVGGKPSAWKIPSSPSDSLNKWAESLRFHVGDSLVWKYDGGKDSVLQVTKEAYINCNTTNPAANYSNGDTKVKLDRSGSFFFISGTKSNCVEGEKLHIVVMSSSRGGGHTGGFFTGSAPSPAPSSHALSGAPAVSPATGSANSLNRRIGVLGFVGLAVVLLCL
ncbi:Early nodulin-like protein 3 [Raphanus sativus]|uniref:Early nodulin-like protein 13 n=1 Tax=Raphanus sativus TaxID=3726 RepID=A0A6J0NJQ6_RAPSA|nr:early nodulin-like protein 13 [Raphanus sativus]KAJ4900536.1 Early nodulin-like protein 3 [Raphanus sativus]